MFTFSIVSWVLVLWLVSEICELNGEKNLEIYSFQLTALEAILHTVWYSNLSQSYIPYGHMFTLTNLELRKPQTESIIPYTHNQWKTMAIPIHSTTTLCDIFLSRVLFVRIVFLSLDAVTCTCVCKLCSLCVLVSVCCVSLDTGCVGRVGAVKDL